MATRGRKAAPALAQLVRRGEAADVWQPVSVGSYDSATGVTQSSAATGEDESGVVWTKTTVTVLVINSKQDVLTADYGLLPAGTLSVRFNPNALKPRRRMRLVLTSAGRVEGEDYSVTRTAGSSADVLRHPFIVSIESVRQVDNTFADSTYSLVANSNAAAPFGPDSLLWLSGTKPADGTTFGIRYTRHPVYEMAWDNGALSLQGNDTLLMPITVPLVNAQL